MVRDATIAYTREDLEHVDPELAALVQEIPGYDPWALHPDGWHFDPDLAWRALGWFPRVLKFVSGPRAGQPFELDRWQASIVACLWGFRKPDGSRRFNTCFLYVGKKNGKSAFTAGIILLAMSTDGQQGFEAYSVASTQKQAGNVFKHVAGMVKQQPKFAGRYRILGNKGGTVQKSVTDESTMSSYRVICSDADTIDGLEPDLAIIDELHRHKTGETMDVVRRSGRNNPNALFVITTTADHDRESACNSELKRAKAIRDNQGDPSRPGYAPTYLPCVWEADREQALEIGEDGLAGWERPEVWAQANPGLGTIKPLAALEEGAQEVRDTPSRLNDFLRLDLNIVTSTAQTWLDMAAWDRCAGGETVAQLRERLKGRPCFGALDLSRTRDQTSFVLWFSEERVVLPWYWLPKDHAAHVEKAQDIPYAYWQQEGLIELIPGEVIEPEVVEAKIVALSEAYGVQEIGYDPYAAENTRQNLEKAGLQMVLMRQGHLTLSEPTKEIERLVLKGGFAHGGHPILRFNASNAAIRYDANRNIMPCKRTSTGPIDGILAFVMAVGRSILGEPARESLNDIYAREEYLDI